MVLRDDQAIRIQDLHPLFRKDLSVCADTTMELRMINTSLFISRHYSLYILVTILNRVASINKAK
jgi:hypothetical protein